MKNIILASTSTIYGGEYLEYLLPVIKELFAGVDEIIFIPYARPGGISHDEYTNKTALFFATAGIRVRGLYTFPNPVEALQNSKGIFTGGGNTFLLVKQLHDLQLMQVLADQVKAGTPYLGTSAGSNIGGINMQTTNDMPIVYPSSFETMGLVPFNINPHYLDPMPNLPHMGETRDVRIKEFHSQHNIPVVGLREGSWIRGRDEQVIVEGMAARIFLPGHMPYELAQGNEIYISLKQ
jgi:dipeptidase E